MAQISVNLEPSKIINRQSLTTLARVLMVLTFLLAFGTFAALNVLALRQAQQESTNLTFNPNEYNIVFLNNNLFYFCQIVDFTSEYLQCNNPYYLVRRKETADDGTKEEKVFVSKPEDEEIYKPGNAIYIYKPNVVYITRVGDESEVLKYINEQAK